MTNAQKWVSVFLTLFILLLVLSKVTARQGSEVEEIESIIEVNTQPAGIDVKSLLANNRCYTCHGRNLNGTGMAPSLAKVGDNWKIANLVSYLQNPKAFLNNTRMVVLKQKYGREMPAQTKMTIEELNALAEYLINRYEK